MISFSFACSENWVLSKSTAPRIESMNFNTGDESRSDLEARLDRILREPETRVSTPEPRQPEVVSTPPVIQVEAPAVAKKTPTKSIGERLKPMFEAVSESLKKAKGWGLSLVKRSKSSKPSKVQGVIQKIVSGSRKVFRTRVKKSVAVVAGVSTLVAATGLALLLSVASVTVTSGIETTLGSSENRTVLTLRASDANQGDLLVASLGVDIETNEEILVMGTVFSKNDQTYALYDGEVIWQITAEQILGKVLFAEATETP